MTTFDPKKSSFTVNINGKPVTFTGFTDGDMHHIRRDPESGLVTACSHPTARDSCENCKEESSGQVLVLSCDRGDNRHCECWLHSKTESCCKCGDASEDPVGVFTNEEGCKALVMEAVE